MPTPFLNAMKIQVTFPEDLRQVLPGTVAVVPGDPEPEQLRSLSLEKQAVLVGGDPKKELICAVEGRLHRQRPCFTEGGATDVEIIPTPFGRIALCCGEDIFQPMYPRLAALRGCVLLIARLERMEDSLLIPGPWSACQSNCLPIALAVGNKGQLILPCAMTEDGSGFGKTAFTTEALREAYREFPIFDSLNKAFYRRYREVLTK